MKNENLNPSSRRSLRRVRHYTIFGLLVWFLSALIAGWLDLFTSPGKPPVAIGLFIAIPIVFFGTLYALNPWFRAFTNSMSLPLIIGAHLWRYVGIGFAVAVLLGHLPTEFGIPEGLGDVVAAGFALTLALALHWKKPVRGYFVAWNIFGLVDLISAITMGVLYSEGSLGVLRTEVSTRLMTTFPVNLIPAFFVPLFILLHVLALLRRNEVAAKVPSTKSHAQSVAV